MTTTNTNKQPVFVDRPLIRSIRLTNQVVGNETSLVVQGSQNPAILVDMDAALASDNNSGGIVDSIRITRDNRNVAITPDYIINASTSGTYIGLVSGQTVYVQETGVLANAPTPGVGYYTYVNGTASGGVNTDFTYSGAATGADFTFTSVEATVLPSVTFAVYLTSGTTVPIPGDGDYKLLFSKTLEVNEVAADCTDQLPEIATPVPNAGNTTGLDEASPLRNRAINLQRGQRLYIGVQQRGVYNNQSGYIPGAHVTAQGGFY